MKIILSIVIPAYKSLYLNEALDSINKQTNKNFSVYIGDDASPEDLKSIVLKYQDTLNITYVKFDENLGSSSLVEHWNRCISLVKTEEWVWLFSDDDIMDETCVQAFYDSINKNKLSNLFHFNTRVIDKNGAVKKVCKEYPKHLTPSDFFRARIENKINSYVVEYIFKKEIFYSSGGFTILDLAWCADDATWINFSLNTGITTLDGAFVNWRTSDINISSDYNESIITRKINATILYFIWVKKIFLKNDLIDLTSDWQKFKWILSLIKNRKRSTLISNYKEIINTSNKLDYGFKVIFLSLIFITLYRLFKSFQQK